MDRQSESKLGTVLGGDTSGEIQMRSPDWRNSCTEFGGVTGFPWTVQHESCQIVFVGDHSLSPDAAATDGIPQVGELIAEKYRVESVVGTGGMGVVFAARHIHLDQCVAIKVLQLPLDDERREEWITRFFHEGRIAAGLRSEHIAQVYDLGLLEESNTPYMVMELLDGADLTAMLGWQKQLSVEQAVECVRQAASAIALAHRKGIVHRDLKPSNLFVTKRLDGSGLIKVLDFGISKVLDQPENAGSLTTSRAVLGSPFYMSPEQIRDAKRVDHRTDIWSLGAILHELLSGSPPFEADTLPAACAAIVADPPPSIRELRDDVPEGLESVVLRCLAKNPADRFNFAGDLLVALQPFSAAARGHAPPRFNTRPSLLEAAAAAAAPPRSESSSSQPVSATPKAALHVPVVAPRRPAPVSDAEPRTIVPSGSDPGQSVDAMSVTLSSEQPSRPFVSSAADPVAARDQQRGSGTGAVTAKPSAKRRFVVAAAAGLSIVGVVWFGSSKEPAPPTASPPASSMAPTTSAATTFFLLIQSTPSGAEVYENNERLGTTPLALKSSKRGGPRKFELRREGYETYSFEQFAAEHDTTHAVELVPLAEPVTSTAPFNSAPTHTARPPKIGAEPAPASSAPSDIRMSR